MLVNIVLDRGVRGNGQPAHVGGGNSQYRAAASTAAGSASSGRDGHGEDAAIVGNRAACVTSGRRVGCLDHDAPGLIADPVGAATAPSGRGSKRPRATNLASGQALRTRSGCISAPLRTRTSRSLPPLERQRCTVNPFRWENRRVAGHDQHPEAPHPARVDQAQSRRLRRQVLR